MSNIAMIVKLPVITQIKKNPTQLNRIKTFYRINLVLDMWMGGCAHNLQNIQYIDISDQNFGGKFGLGIFMWTTNLV